MIPERSDDPIVGWRCWFVMPHERVLRPIFKRGLAWTPRQAVQAICPEKAHVPPANGCKCGIWAVSSPKDLSEIEWVTDPPDGVDRVPGGLVVGQIAMWADVVEHERGWRSS